MAQLNALGLTLREINHSLVQLIKEEKHVLLQHPECRNNMAIGLSGRATLVIDGDVGAFCAAFLNGPTVEIKGDAGTGLADSISSGTVVVRGNTGPAAGVGMRGGTVIIRGNAGSRVAYGKTGGTLIVARNAGAFAGAMMMGGELIILGDAADKVGEFIYGGLIYVGGRIASTGINARVEPCSESDIARLQDSLGLWGLSVPRKLHRISPEASSSESQARHSESMDEQ